MYMVNGIYQNQSWVCMNSLRLFSWKFIYNMHTILKSYASYILNCMCCSLAHTLPVCWPNFTRKLHASIMRFASIACNIWNAYTHRARYVLRNLFNNIAQPIKSSYRCVYIICVYGIILEWWRKEEEKNRVTNDEMRTKRIKWIASLLKSRL